MCPPLLGVQTRANCTMKRGGLGPLQTADWSTESLLPLRQFGRLSPHSMQPFLKQSWSTVCDKQPYVNKKQQEMLDVLHCLYFLCCYRFFTDFIRGGHCIAFQCRHATYTPGVIKLPPNIRSWYSYQTELNHKRLGETWKKCFTQRSNDFST